VELRPDGKVASVCDVDAASPATCVTARMTIWFSVKADLIEAVREEFERLGYKIPVKLIN
jgi:hypothetical protein